MRARSVPEITSVAEAQALLGLAGLVAPDSLDGAFRAAIKAADDPDRYRRVIAAWRLLQAVGVPPPALPLPGPSIGITPLQALRGDRVHVDCPGRTVEVRIPAGTRTGDILGVTGGVGSPSPATVVIRPGDGLSVVGDDLYMTVQACPRLLRDGGRIEIATHAGLRSAWITPGLVSPRLRLRDLGLPPRRDRAQGHLFVTLEPAIDGTSLAEDMLARFSRAWAEPLAA